MVARMTSSDSAALVAVITDLERRIKSLERAPYLRNASIDGAYVEVRDDDGNVRQIVGQQPDGTYTITDQGAPPPPVPSPPTVDDTRPGVLVVSWDGATADGEPWPADWVRVEVHIALAAGTAPTDQNQVATFTSPAGGSATLAFPEGTYYVTLTAANTSGRESGPSEEAPGTVTPSATGGGGSSDGDAPAASPAPTIIPGIGTLFVKWDPIDNDDAVTYAVHAVAGTTDFTADASNLIGTAAGTFLPIRALADDTPLVQGTSYAVKIVASDADGPGPASSVTVGIPAQVTGPDIAVGALTADMLTANDALFEALQAQTITGVEIEGGEFRTDAGANRIYIGKNPSGGQLHNGVIHFYSEDLDSPAIIQASSSGTLSVASGGDADLSDPDHPIQNASIGLAGVGPFSAYTTINLEAESVTVGGTGGHSTADGLTTVRANDRVRLESPNRVEVDAAATVDVDAPLVTVGRNDGNLPAIEISNTGTMELSATTVTIGRHSASTPVIQVNENETWHLIGSNGEPPFASAWTTYSSPAFSPGFRKLPDGDVIFRGSIAGGLYGQDLCILPVGYRPPAQATLLTIANGSTSAGGTANEKTGRVDILPTGAVRIYTHMPASGGWIALPTLRFTTLPN